MADQKVEYEKLGKAGLSFIDVIAQSVGFMGPVFGAILLLITVVGANNAGKGAGLASPLAIIVAAVGVGTRLGRCTTTSRRASANGWGSCSAGSTRAACWCWPWRSRC